jgi:ActR/RegA family two-component response regulator
MYADGLNRELTEFSQTMTVAVASFLVLNLVAGIGSALSVVAGIFPTESANTVMLVVSFFLITLAILPIWLTTSLYLAAMEMVEAISVASLSDMVVHRDEEEGSNQYCLSSAS